MDFINPYYATIILGLIQVLGCTLGLVLVNKLGCRGLLLNSLAFCSLTMTALAISIHMKWQWMSLIMLILFTLSFMSGLSNVPWVLVGELPTGKYLLHSANVFYMIRGTAFFRNFFRNFRCTIKLIV